MKKITYEQLSAMNKEERQLSLEQWDKGKIFMKIVTYEQLSAMDKEVKKLYEKQWEKRYNKRLTIALILLIVLTISLLIGAVLCVIQHLSIDELKSILSFAAPCLTWLFIAGFCIYLIYW